jgi:hypothetical protein
MNRLLNTRTLLAATVAVGALVAASAAQARTDVFVSIGLPGYGYVQPAPVYVQPAPVYVQPAPVYLHRSRYVQPAPVYVQPEPVYVQPEPVYYERHHRHHRRGAWGDADRDGVPNRYDHAPFDPYRR